MLEKETVEYCSTQEERDLYEICFCEGLVHRRAHGGEVKQEGKEEEEETERTCTRMENMDEKWVRVDTGPDGWIFVLRDKTIYAREKKTDSPPR